MTSEPKKKSRYHSNELKPQMIRFAEEYIVDLNGTKAAERAGYSVKTANEQGSMLLKRPRVQELVQKLMSERSERTRLTADQVLQEIAIIATLDLKDAYDENGQLRKVPDMPERVRRAVASVDITLTKEDVTAKLKTYDKLKALELYGKHLKLFTEVIKHEGAIGIADLLSEARARVKNGRG